MAERRLYPVGRSVFPELVEEGLVYVDKTRYVWDMTHSGAKFVFLSRPRRFGKTLLVSTLEAYFQGRRELFDGLALGELEEEWTAHPVLRFDLSRIRATTREELEAELGDAIGLVERQYGLDNSGMAPGRRVDRLILKAAAGEEKSVVLLVDEYDSPLLSVMHDEELLQEFREVMRGFYAPLKANDALLRFVFLTGITKFSQLSVFSELNNLLNISMSPVYAGICGITEDELAEVMGPDVELLGERLGVGAEEAHAMLKAKYDGYHFAKSSPDVYNPYSLVTAFINGDLGSYWFESGTPSSLVNVLRAYDFDIPELEGFQAEASTFDAPAERMTSPVPFLYQSGYLTIKGYDREDDFYTLGIPNEEVSDGFYKTLLPVYVGGEALAYSSFMSSLVRALRSDDIEEALRQLKSFLASIPYDMAAKDEKTFQTQLFIILRLVGSRIATEVRTSTGRVDAVLRTRTSTFVVELKYGKSAEEAVAQIDERGYLLPWEADGTRLVKVGASFDPDQRTLGEWIVREATR